MSELTYINGFIEYLQGKKLDIVILSMLYYLVYHHERMLVPLELV